MQKKKKTWLVVIVIALLVCLLTGGILWLCLGKDPSVREDPTEPTKPSDSSMGNETTEPATDEPETATRMLDRCDEIGAWIGTGVVRQTEAPAEGEAWLAATTRNAENALVLSRAFDPVLDLRGYRNGYLHMYIYVEDASALQGGQIELSSSGNPDLQELSWNLMLYAKKSGWNEVWLPFAAGDRVGGEIDLQKVSYMRVYALADRDMRFGIDGIQVTNDEPAEENHLDEAGQFVLDEIEALGPWIGTAPKLVSGNAPVGNGYLFTDTRDGDALVLSRTFEPLDMSAFKNGYLHMWIYVGDLSRVTGGQIELTSAGVPDTRETSWDILAFIKNSGWNEVYLPVAKANQVGGGADFSAINFMRIFLLSNGSNKLGADYICMSMTAPPEPSRIDAMNQFVLDKVEAMETWTGSGAYLSYSGAPVGSAYVASSQTDAAGANVLTRTLTGLDASGYKDGYLHFWLYVKDADIISGGQIELTSSGEPDKQETSWNVGGLDLKDGWNELYLPVSEANRAGGGANFTNLNYLRVYVISNGRQTIGLDYIALSHTAPQKESPVDEKGNYIIDEIHGIAPWSGPGLVFNTKNGHDAAADWLSCSMSGAGDIFFFRNFATSDLTDYKNGYLHLWVYVNDIATMTGGMIEISSSGTVDEEELWWPLLDYVTQSGWNEIWLPFAKAQHQGEHEADITRLNCIRVVAMVGAAGGNVGIDDIYATKTAPEKPVTPVDGVIDMITEIGAWEGSNLTYHESDGYQVRADYLSAKTAGAGDLVFFRIFPAKDGSSFKDGYLHIYIYLDKLSNMTNGWLELTSSGTVDEEELWWPLADYVSQDGWNELYLPLRDAQHEGTRPVDLTKLNCMRVVISVGADGGEAGIDEIYLTNTTEKEELHTDAVEAWLLNDGGTQSAVASEVENGTTGVNKWGVWLSSRTFGRVLDFSTEGSMVTAENTKANFTDSFAISAWVMAPQRESGERVLLQRGANGAGFRLLLDAKGELSFEGAGLSGLASSGRKLNDGKWHHVMVSRDGGKLTYYVDGTSVKTLTVSGTMPAENTDIYLGADAEGRNGLDGSLAEVRLFMTATEPEKATQTVLFAQDNEPQNTYLSLKRGIAIDRRQYSQPEPDPSEGQTVTENDIINCMNMGFDHVKLLLTPNHLIDENGHLIEENLAYIDRVVGYVQNNGFKCIVCLHPEGDFKAKYLGNLEEFEKLVNWYGEFAAWVEKHWSPDTVAIQLMTEPNSNTSEVSWTWMSDRIWGAVRNALPKHTLITSSDLSGNLEYLKKMSPASDQNLIYSFTTYEPYTIGWYYYNTNYGQLNAWSYVRAIPYPVEEGKDYTDAIEYAIALVPEELKAGIRADLWAYVRGEYDGAWHEMVNHYDSLYNADWHMLRAQSLDAWRSSYGGNIHIMCVEFGCMDADTPRVLWQTSVEGAGISEEDRLAFTRDMRSSFDAYNIGWDYWSYNEAHTIFRTDAHTYGASPEPGIAAKMFDYEMLGTGLGVQPLVTPEGSILIIDEVSRAGDWIGTASTLETTGGHADGATWLKASDSAVNDIVFFRTFPDKNGTAYQNGYLHVWLYVDKVENLTGGMLELSSAYTVDEEELWWALTDYVKKDGWNELYLPISTAQTQGTRPTDMSKLNCMRIVAMHSAGALTVGIDEIYLTNEAGGGEEETELVIDPVTEIGAWQGTPFTYETAGGNEEGAGWLRSSLSSAGDLVFFRVFPAVNAAKYQNGYVHAYLYIDDIEHLKGGMLEITSSGTVDEEECWWPLLKYVTKSGWNEVKLPFAEAEHQGNNTTSFSRLNCIRVVMSVAPEGVGGIDEISIAKGDGPAPVEPSYKEAVAAAKARSILNVGSDNMKAAIAAVVDKAARGEKLTFVTLGDSITAGASASAGKDWTNLVREYLEGLDGDSTNGNVTAVNAGIGSTEAVLGVSRVERDVLVHAPDLVIVDFGTNDYGLPYGAEAYEGILTKLISAGIPVINSNVCPENGNNIQEKQKPINDAYGVPQISFKTAYFDLANETSITGLRARDIWSDDHVHPTTKGHALLAELLIHYLQTEIVDKNIAPGTLDTALPGRVTDNGFADAVLVENTYAGDKVTVDCGSGWTGDYSARIYQLSTEGWQTNTLDSSITFKTSGAYFYMFFTLAPNSGDLEIRVDGMLKETINWAYLGTGYMNAHHITHLGTAGEHTITLTLKDNANVEEEWFGICAVGAASFSPAAPDSGSVTLREVESLLESDGWGWIGTEPALQTEDARVGNAWIKTGNAACAVLATAMKDTDISRFSTDGYLHMWFYVDDASAIVNGQIELSSAGSGDQAEASWNIENLGIKDGWNELYLPFVEANHVDGTSGSVNYAAINYTRVYTNFTGEHCIGIDKMEVVAEKPEASALGALTVREVEALLEDGWQWVPDGIQVMTEGAKVGNAWLKSTSAAWPTLATMINPLDISAYVEANGYLHMWLWVEEGTNVVAGQIELTSSGAPDSQELSWNMAELGLKDGWNELYLPFATANREGTEAVNPKAINYIRIFTGALKEHCIGIDKMEAVAEKPEAPALGALTVREVEALLEDGWQWVPDGIQVMTEGAKVGNAWLKSTSAAWPTLATMINPLDISAYVEANGYLHMWLWVEEGTNVVAGQIELTSSGAPDSQELSWNMAELGLKDGWNELYLPFATANREGTEAVNPKAINYIRIFTGALKEHCIGIDKMEAVAEKQ